MVVAAVVVIADMGCESPVCWEGANQGVVLVHAVVHVHVPVVVPVPVFVDVHVHTSASALIFEGACHEHTSIHLNTSPL